MCYWDFLTILEAIKIKNARMSGKPTFKKELPEHSKDMIHRLKDSHDRR